MFDANSDEDSKATCMRGNRRCSETREKNGLLSESITVTSTFPPREMRKRVLLKGVVSRGFCCFMSVLC